MSAAIRDARRASSDITNALSGQPASAIQVAGWVNAARTTSPASTSRCGSAKSSGSTAT